RSIASGSTRRSTRGDSRYENNGTLGRIGRNSLHRAHLGRCTAGPSGPAQRGQRPALYTEEGSQMIAALLVLLMAGGPAQAPRDARLTVAVLDQTGAVIQNATVTVTPSGDPKPPVAPVQTGEKGVANVQGLPPGRYSIHAEFAGFQPRILKDVQLKSGDNKHVRVLALEGVQASVTGAGDAREAASDRRATFGTAMTREQIEALSDDPDEMAQQLQNLAGGNASTP